MKFNLTALFFFGILGSILLLGGCISPKDTVTSRSMQNLTARYNIIYNANLMLEESARNIEKGYIDNYSELLTIYKEPSEALAGAETKNLDSISRKASNIVNEKLNSNYVDEAYLLMAKSNYLKAQFFNASEYFNYIYKTYPLEKENRQQALVWNGRALMQLENMVEASNTLDTALKYIENSKKYKADVYATYAQLLISSNKEKEALTMLEKAIEAEKNKQNKIRWTYILAQLQEENKLYQDAYKNFSKVVKSNASFEMAFNARLNRIRIEEEQSGKKVDRVTRLRSLLKDDKNIDFIDQIYYQIGNSYAEKKQWKEAIENYQTSIKKSTLNQNQKGISYLSIADVYFNQGDYVKAKAYYDTTLTTLSPKYPGFDVIQKKGNNLELLANRFRSISREDNLQQLASLPEAQREERIGELVRQLSQNAIAQANQQNTGNSLTAGIDNPSSSRLTEGKFYFNNSTALSQGLVDFKRKWGNRRLEDNWRRAIKTAEESTQTMATDPDAPIGASLAVGTNSLPPETIRQNFLKDLPLTESLLQQSNQRIAEAYYDIANFYKDELKDEELAIETYEKLLQKTPNSTYSLPVYYNLYRLYQGPDEKKSVIFKDLILSKYGDSPFAKVIRDPNYSKQSDEQEIALNTAYNQLFNLYTQKKYSEIISFTKPLEQQFPNNKLAPQIAYLNAMAVGHTQKLPAFESSLQGITNTYPSDELITPLVKQHLLYVQGNRMRMAARITALTDYDAMEPAFIEDAPIKKAIANIPSTPAKPEVNQPAQPILKQPEAIVAQNPDQTATSSNTPVPASVPTPEPTINAPTKPKPAISQFTLPGAAQYYFAINVLDMSATLSSSRFGIGQFNRTKYTGSVLKHQVQEINNENSLILVGVFDSYESVKAYETAISPVLKDIMKVPAQQYTTFVITKESLDKLQNRSVINSYIEFYKSSN